MAANRRDLARDLARFQRGMLALSDAALERRLYGRSAGLAEAPSGNALRLLGRHKAIEDAPRYDILRAAMGLLPRRQMRVLDLGCGRGRLLLYAALLGAREAMGIEIVAVRAALAAGAAARLELEAMRVIEGDALTLPWPEADAVFAMNPFYPSQYRRLRKRLIDYSKDHAPLIVAMSTLRDRLAADRRFEICGEAAVEWIKLAAFRVRG